MTIACATHEELILLYQRGLERPYTPYYMAQIVGEMERRVTDSIIVETIE